MLTREDVFQRDGYRCLYCHGDVTDRPITDHIIGARFGGDDLSANLATCCERCNLRKSNAPGANSEVAQLVAFRNAMRGWSGAELVGVVCPAEGRSHGAKIKRGTYSETVRFRISKPMHDAIRRQPNPTLFVRQAIIDGFALIEKDPRMIEVFMRLDAELQGGYEGADDASKATEAEG